MEAHGLPWIGEERLCRLPHPEGCLVSRGAGGDGDHRFCGGQQDGWFSRSRQTCSHSRGGSYRCPSCARSTSTMLTPVIATVPRCSRLERRRVHRRRHIARQRDLAQDPRRGRWPSVPGACHGDGHPAGGHHLRHRQLLLRVRYCGAGDIFSMSAGGHDVSLVKPTHPAAGTNLRNTGSSTHSSCSSTSAAMPTGRGGNHEQQQADWPHHTGNLPLHGLRPEIQQRARLSH